MFLLPILVGVTWEAGPHYMKADQKMKQGNAITGDNILTYDTSNCIVNINSEKIAVLQGLDGYIIAESDDIFMICKREDEDQIKKFVTDARMKNGDSLV